MYTRLRSSNKCNARECLTTLESTEGVDVDKSQTSKHKNISSQRCDSETQSSDWWNINGDAGSHSKGSNV